MSSKNIKKGDPRRQTRKDWGNSSTGVLAPVEEIAKLYESGLSTRQIAMKVGYSPSFTHKIVQKLGLSRGKSEAAILRQPPTSKARRNCHAMARKIMERHLGRKLRTEEEVHHKDRDFTNNALDNLQVLTEEEHRELHWAPESPDRIKPYNPLPKHKRPERIAQMKIWNAKNRYVDGVCEWCLATFRRDKYALNKTCSISCGQKRRRCGVEG